MTENELNWMILDLVVQGCSVDHKDYDLDSGFIGIYADAMDYLESIEWVEILQPKEPGVYPDNLRWHRCRQGKNLKRMDNNGQLYWKPMDSVPTEPKS